MYYINIYIYIYILQPMCMVSSVIVSYHLVLGNPENEKS